MSATKKTILIVDDDAKIAHAMSLTLKSEGYEVVTAEDGLAGLSSIESKQPDLIIADIWMPLGAGFALAYRLRQAGSELPVIFVSARKRKGLREAARNFGAVDFLEKPCESEALLAAVARGLAGPPAQTAPPIAPKPESGSRACRILVVEDDERIAASLALRLKAAGYEYDLASDGLAGVISAVSRSPDLLILDISLPRRSGFEVAERVRKLLPPATPVIFITASKQTAMRERAQELGAAAFFEKPYDGGELMAAIAKALVESAGASPRPPVQLHYHRPFNAC